MQSSLARPLLALLALVACGSAAAQAQCLDWRTFPLTSPAVNAIVSSVVVHDDGSGPALYVGGAMTPSSILRWDGASYSDVGVGLNGVVSSLAEFDDGSGLALYAGGDFSIPGVPGMARLARWDGVSWQLVGGAAPDGWVVDLEVHDDGSGPALYVGGSFTHVGTLAAGAIARWNGSAWSVVGPLAGYAPGNRVVRMASHVGAQGPTLIVNAAVTGSFWPSTRYYGEWRAGSWRPITAGPFGTTHGIVSWNDGTGPAIYAVGSFYQPFAGVQRWDGSAWTPISDARPCLGIDVVDLGQGPRLYVGTRDDGTVRRRENGTWTDLPGTPNTCSYAGVWAFAGFDAGHGAQLFAGSVPGALGPVNNALASWNGATWDGVGAPQRGISGALRALHVHDAGSGPELYAGGIFCGADEAGARNVARWNGTEWAALATSGPVEVRALATWDPGTGPKLMAGDADARLWQWDGATWSVLGFGTQSFDHFAALQPFGADLYVGGVFTTLNGVASPNVARRTAGGWVPVGAGVNGSVNALTTFDDGNGLALYAGGSFTAANGVPMQHVGRWNGASWTALGSGTNGRVDCFVVFDDGSGPQLIAGGAFTAAGGVPAANVARWNGASWSPLGAGIDGVVLGLEVFDDGSGPALYAGGQFAAPGSAPDHVARWNGASWTEVGGGVDGTVSALRTFDDGTGLGAQLFAGGDFQVAGAQYSSAFAAWRGCSGPIARFCFGDGSVAACPCGNQGVPSRGCDNSASTGGARLNATGSTQPDTISLYAAGELPNAATLVFQGDALLTAPIRFGDGLRCVGGNLVRLYTTNAVQGSLAVPGPGQPSVSARSAAQGDPLAPGDVRGYQAWYRDANPGFCGAPTGNAWNLSNAVRIVW